MNQKYTITIINCIDLLRYATTYHFKAFILMFRPNCLYLLSLVLILHADTN
jgi:hypothetical protein